MRSWSWEASAFHPQPRAPFPPTALRAWNAHLPHGHHGGSSLPPKPRVRPLFRDACPDSTLAKAGSPPSVLSSCPGTTHMAPMLVYIRVSSPPRLDSELPEGGQRLIRFCSPGIHSTCSAKACRLDESVSASVFQDCHPTLLVPPQTALISHTPISFLGPLKKT